MPFAIVQGVPWVTVPKDLYIPPDALEVILDAFEGPLDLLLYLIRRQNLDILDIPIAAVTAQYMEYVELMREVRLELAAEYLVMAAMLCEIKSRMLLPRPAGDDDDEGEDPRAELVRRLQEYERYKQAAEDLDGLPREGREIHVATAEPPRHERIQPLPEVSMQELTLAFAAVLHRADQFAHHQIQRESLSLRERMARVLDLVSALGAVEFSRFFDASEGRPGVVVSFMAILELIKESLIVIIQVEPFSPIHLRAAGADLEAAHD